MILRKVKLIPLLIDLPLSFFLSLSLFREPAAHVQLQDTWSRRPDSTRAKNRHQYFILRFSFRLACFYFIHFLSNSLCLSIFFTFPLIQIWSRSILSTVKHNKKKIWLYQLISSCYQHFSFDHLYSPLHYHLSSENFKETAVQSRVYSSCLA